MFHVEHLSTWVGDTARRAGKRGRPGRAHIRRAGEAHQAEGCQVVGRARAQQGFRIDIERWKQRRGRQWLAEGTLIVRATVARGKGTMRRRMSHWGGICPSRGLAPAMFHVKHLAARQHPTRGAVGFSLWLSRCCLVRLRCCIWMLAHPDRLRRAPSRGPTTLLGRSSCWPSASALLVLTPACWMGH